MSVIRKIQYPDLDVVRKLLFSLNDMHYQALAPDYKTPEELDKAIDLDQYIDGENEVGFVAESGGQVVGFVVGNIFERKGLVLNTVKTASIADIYVDERHRSGGVGKKMMDAFEKDARQKGATEIIVEIYAFNQLAIDFYKSVGLEPFLVIGKKSLLEV